MKVCRWRTVLLAMLAVSAHAVAAPTARGSIGAGTFYSTPYFVFRGGAPGPVVLVQGGIHGNEMSGTYALDQIVPRITIRNGALIVVPRLNAPAVAKGVRYIYFDLNRAFADPSRNAPYEFALAKEVVALASQARIDYVLTLHDARHQRDGGAPESLGQSICYGTLPEPPLLRPWLARLNATIPKYNDKFAGTYYPIPSSSTEVMVSRLHLKGGFCVETWSGLPLQQRITMQRNAVETFLTSVGLDHRMTEF